jgi:Xaa-Pro aminopeptidase
MNKAWSAAAAAVLVAGRAGAGEMQEDLAARRALLMQRLGAETVFLIQSPPPRVYSRDVDYEYRQDSNLYYLTGVDQEGTALALVPGAAAARELLFVHPRDAAREHREGRRLSREEAQAQSGIQSVYGSAEVEPFLDAVLTGQAYPRRSYGAPVSDTFTRALGEGRARVALLLEPVRLSGPLSPAHELARRLKERYPQLQVVDASPLVAALRQVKTPYERKVLARSVELSARAMQKAMKAARPGLHEYSVRAALEGEWTAGGALGWGYPPIVASGPNATILHYPRYSRRLEDGDLLLIDAAANVEYLTGDITRTWPVNGRFTPAQREVYELVLAAQEAGIRAARAGVRPGDVHEATVKVIKDGLLRMGLITDAAGDQYRRWYTHGSVHFIGMDVHDVGDYERPLEPGMAFVIEPGLYLRADALEGLPPTPENRTFAEKVRPVLDRYRDIGVRIEDSFLLTESGLQNLSAAAPRTLAEVEAFLAR